MLLRGEEGGVLQRKKTPREDEQTRYNRGKGNRTEMKTIIAGSREITDYQRVINAVSMIDWQITAVICGMARGVDKLGEKFALQNQIPVHYYPAEWHIHGKSAGYLRNVEMAKNADALIAIWDGKSRGTMHMINIARDHNLRVFVYSPDHERDLFENLVAPSNSPP